MTTPPICSECRTPGCIRNPKTPTREEPALRVTVISKDKSNNVVDAPARLAMYNSFDGSLLIEWAGGEQTTITTAEIETLLITPGE